jgi:hypothetical protein
MLVDAKLVPEGNAVRIESTDDGVSPVRIRADDRPGDDEGSRRDRKRRSGCWSCPEWPY